jgi:hypothetical protein
MLGWVLASIPGFVHIVLVLTYFSRIGARRQRAIRLLVAADAKDIYVRSYAPGRDDNIDWSRVAELKKLPFAVTIGLTWLACFVVTPAMLVKVGVPLRPLPDYLTAQIAQIDPAVFAGFMGAYIWGLYDCLTRFRVQNWTASSQNFTWLRLLIGTALGGLIGQPFKETYSPLVAFGLGTFPAETLRRWLQGRAGTAVGIDPAQDDPVSPPWSLIQGVASGTIDRLVEADVLSPVHLATADPVVLYCRTNIEWRTILDLIDQALLATYVGDAISKLRGVGIRGAIEMAVVHERLTDSEGEVVGEARGVVTMLAKLLGNDEVSVLHLARNLAEDSQVSLIWKLWYRDS